MGLKRNFDLALDGEAKKASTYRDAPRAEEFKKMLKKSKIGENEDHPGKTCEEAHPGKSHEESYQSKKDVEETTTASGAGAYVGPLFQETKEKKQDVEETTLASSSGQYSTPKMWAKDKKNWRGAAKPTYAGGQFVKVKKKCSTFPYCNQGDINALELTEHKMIKEAVKKVSKKTGKTKGYIEELVKKEIEEIIRRAFYKSPVTDPESGIVGVGKMETPIGKIYSFGGNKPKYE
jgi:hypothetical protein